MFHLHHLLSVLLSLALHAQSTAVLVTFSDDICNSTAGNTLFSIATNEQCQIMHYITSWNIDAVAAGCSGLSSLLPPKTIGATHSLTERAAVYIYDDPICTTNPRLAPAVGVCVKQNSAQEGVQVICNGRLAGTGAVVPATTIATSTAALSASTSTATAASITTSGSSISSSSTTSSNGGISKYAQIALATILPLVALAAIGVLGFYIWAKHRRGGYVRSSAPTTERGAAAGMYSWDERRDQRGQMGGHNAETQQMRETKNGVVLNSYSSRGEDVVSSSAVGDAHWRAELDRKRDAVEAPRGRDAVEAP